MFAQGADAECVMALGQAAAFAISYQSAMKPGWIREAQRAVEKDLARGGLEQVTSADNFSDVSGVVVDNACELIAGQTVFTPDEEITEVDAGDEGLRAGVEIVKEDGLVVGDAEAVVGLGWAFLLLRKRSRSFPFGKLRASMTRLF